MNKHKYMGTSAADDTDCTIKHIIGGPLTGFLFADAQRQVTCPKCGSGPGFMCETPKGSRAYPPHAERVNTLNGVGG